VRVLSISVRRFAIFLLPLAALGVALLAAEVRANKLID